MCQDTNSGTISYAKIVLAVCSKNVAVLQIYLNKIIKYNAIQCNRLEIQILYYILKFHYFKNIFSVLPMLTSNTHNCDVFIISGCPDNCATCAVDGNDAAVCSACNTGFAKTSANACISK